MSKVKVDILREEVVEAVKKGVNELLDGSVSTVEFLRLCPNGLVEILIDMGFDVDIKNLESYGWEADYWIYCSHEGRKYLIFGSGFYGTLRMSEARVELIEGVS